MAGFLNNLLTTTLIGALVLGVGGRVWMFLIGWVLAGNLSFTLAGSLEVVFFGGILGLGSGLFYLLLIYKRVKRKLFEGTFFGLGTFLVLSYLPIDGKEAVLAFKPVYHFPILLGFSALFWFYGIAVSYGISKNTFFLKRLRKNQKIS